MLRLTLLFLAPLLLAAQTASKADATPLDRYVHAPDPVYDWKLIRSLKAEGVEADVLELTSQSWRSAKDVDKPVWKHWLTIVRPTQGVKHNKGILFIGAGNNNNPAPATVPERAAQIARDTGTVVAELGMVPNQPLRFTDSPNRARVEDDIIAYSRVKHFATKDDTWLVRLAMVKSGVRALDAIQEFCRQKRGIQVDQFVVSGGSKRGWTTWLVGLTDKRVIAIIPVVIDALNSEVITRHHYEAYGFFSSALSDYVEQGLFPGKIGTPEYRDVLRIEDPYEYRERLTLPKYLVNASGDQFFLPDNSQFYYGELRGEKHLRYVPNAKHNLAGSDATESITAYYQSVLDGAVRPQFRWTKDPADGSIHVQLGDGAKPAQVNLWQAVNPKARDFRVDVIGKAYRSSPLSESGPGMYVAKIPKPASGFAAFFVELVYPTGGRYPLKFTTEVSVVPDVLPFQWKDAGRRNQETKR
jgi:PhoPQ-activated pathogenicity-related protein